MKKIFLLLLLLLTASAAYADDSIFLQRIVALEKRVAELEEKLAPVLEAERVKEVAKRQKELAYERMMMDAEFLSRSDLNLIESAYHEANQDWKAEAAKKAVAMLTERYPRANRTGCAVLARAQSTEGSEQLGLLKEAIGKYSGCFYPNGVNVGAYARLYLGMRYKKEGKEKEAAAMFEELRSGYPDAIDHTEQLLTAHLEGLE
jgi:hypothetical protein